MYKHSNMAHNMNPAQRLEILKKEMEHLAMEKEILQAQTRNLEMEREVCKLRQGILALQSGSEMPSTDVAQVKVPVVNEIVVTPRRIVKKSNNKTPLQPAFSPPRFIRRYEEPEEDHPPILTPAARTVQASLDAKKVQKQQKPLTASTFMEHQQNYHQQDDEYEQTSTVPFKLHDSGIGQASDMMSLGSTHRSRKSDLEKFEGNTEVKKTYLEKSQPSPRKTKPEPSPKTEVLTPTARQVKADMEKKQMAKEAAAKAKEDAMKIKKGLDEVDRKKNEQPTLIASSVQKAVTESKIVEKEVLTPVARDIKEKMELKKKEIEEKTNIKKTILTPTARDIEKKLELKKTVIERVESTVVTEIQEGPRISEARKVPESASKIAEIKIKAQAQEDLKKSSVHKTVTASPKTQEPSTSEKSSSDTEKKLTPTARAVQQLIESKKVSEKKPSPKPKSPSSPPVSKQTPTLPDTPKSRGVHFAKVEKVHLNKPFIPDKVMTPEKVKGIIKPPRLTRRPLHPETEPPKPRTSKRSCVYFTKTTVEDQLESFDEEDEDNISSLPSSQSSSMSGSAPAKSSGRSYTSRGKKRQIETDSSNDDFSEIEDSAVTPQPTKRRKTYITTPHPVKGKRRSKSAVTIDDDEGEDDADVSDVSDAVSDSSNTHVKSTSKRGRKSKVVEEMKEIEEESDQPVESDIADEVKEPSTGKKKPVETQPVKAITVDTPSKKTGRNKRLSTQLKQTNKSRNKNGEESNEESEKNEEIVISTPTRKRRSSLLTKMESTTVEEEVKDEVKSTPTKRRRSSLLATSTSGRTSEDSVNDESEDSTIGTPSKRRRSSILPKSGKSASNKMPDIPEDKPVLTPAQRAIMAKMESKSSKTSKSSKKEDSEDSSPEKTKMKKGSKVKEEKKVEDRPNLTPAARQVLAKMQQSQSIKKTKATSEIQTDSEASDSSRRKSKRK